MISDAIQLVHDNATHAALELEEAKRPQRIEIPGQTHVSHFWIKGELQEFAHEIPPRNHVCLTIDSLGEWCGDKDTVIWFNFDRIIVVLDNDAHRENRVTMELTLTEQFKAATQGSNALDQGKFIRWCLDHLRIELEQAHAGFVDMLRAVKFAAGQSGSGTIENGKENFGKSINAEVAGVSAFPDELTIEVPVWAELDVSVKLDLAFVVDPHELKFTLKPLAYSLQQARVVALGKVHEMLEQYQGAGHLFSGFPREE